MCQLSLGNAVRAYSNNRHQLLRYYLALFTRCWRGHTRACTIFKGAKQGHYWHVVVGHAAPRYISGLKHFFKRQIWHIRYPHPRSVSLRRQWIERLLTDHTNAPSWYRKTRRTFPRTASHKCPQNYFCWPQRVFSATRSTYKSGAKGPEHPA